MKNFSKLILAALATVVAASACNKEPAYNSLPVPIPNAVDLGLSVKWTDANIGTTIPYEAGYYYAWGEIVPKSDYSSGTYLDTNFDVVLTKIGSPLRTPTKAEWEELLNTDNCNISWENFSEEVEIPGLRITSRKEGFTDASIFLPAAGMRSGREITDLKYTPCGRYWSSSQDKDKEKSWHVTFSDEGGEHILCTARHLGMNVRAVWP